VSEPLADVIARMQDRYRPHAQASPVTATRKATDSATAMTGGPSGDRGSVLAGAPMQPPTRPRRVNTNANRRNGGKYGGTFQPTAAHFAGNPIPAMARATAPDVMPTHGARVAGTRVAAGVTLSEAEASGADGGYRAWQAARQNLARDAGDILPTGESYPTGITASGRLSPSPRY
jgi:hypothetical protein